MFSALDWLAAIVIGIGATAILDLWALLLGKFGISSLNFCMVGRWLCFMRYGKWQHLAINKAAAQPNECAIGWFSHYFIGVIFALIFLLLMPDNWLAAPSFIPALLFGLLSVVIPFFIMQPALGLGIAAAKTPAPMAARVKSILSHAVFGVGLYLSAMVLLQF
ncbi:MAG: DUF2938 domain-containing protein [Pseudoalteromonas prydzensis]|uniref:DUF2938 domain-containing protein n=1 Tax=Pseudoalteromonas prydzensis TaxID=182141 RepID=A0ABR9FG91_9GAMM|nr:DUF2938 domain-containing protein [Pseudoalteromonas prydzensis]MBE0455885.1 DUF2938 domain-containing protein [Pseudoalteromonas prydzensis]